MADNGKIIGLRIKKIREDKSITQEQVAKAIGVKRSTYAEWEQGTEPKITPLLKIAAFLDVGIEKIVYDLIDDYSDKTANEIEDLKKQMAELSKKIDSQNFINKIKSKKKTRE